MTATPPEAESAPSNPPNVEPVLDVATKVTSVPQSKYALQVLPHIIPNGEEFTIPLPVPMTTTDTKNVGIGVTVGVEVTVGLGVGEGLHVGVDVSSTQRPPMQTPWQSRSATQGFPGAHGMQSGPPQSTPVSAPSWIPSEHKSTVAVTVGVVVGVPVSVAVELGDAVSVKVAVQVAVTVELGVIVSVALRVAVGVQVWPLTSAQPVESGVTVAVGAGGLLLGALGLELLPQP